MPKIDIYKFKGTLPMIPERLLPNENAQTATNLDLNNGKLAPLNTYDATLELTGSNLRAFYLVKSDSDTFWHTSTADFDAVPSPVVLQSGEYGRYYWTDGVIPKKSNFDLASNSGANSNGSPDIAYNLGVPSAPQTGSPTMTITGAAGDDDVYASVSYVHTFVSGWGEEGPPSFPDSNAYGAGDLKTDQYMALGNFGLAADTFTKRNIVGVRVYRANTGSGGNVQYQRLTGIEDSGLTYKKIADWNTGTGTIAISGTAVTGSGTNFTGELSVNDWILCKGQMFKITVITDNTNATVETAADPSISAGASFEYDTPPWSSVNDKDGANDRIYGDVGSPIESLDWEEPYDDLEGLCLLSNNCMAAFRGNDIYISEPNYPFTFPYKYQRSVTSPIVALGHFGTILVVLTTTIPCLFQAYDPKNMSKNYIYVNQACLWKNAVVSGEKFVLYPSPDGLVMITAAGLDVITAPNSSIGRLGIFTKKQWEALLTTTNPYDKEIIATLYDNKYIAFFKGTENGFMVDLNSRDYRTFSLPSTIDVWDTHVDAENDKLYLLVDVSGSPWVIEWEGSDSLLTYTWKSKKFSFPVPVKFPIAQIIGDYSSGVTFKAYADGTQVGGDISVTTNDPFRYGSGGTKMKRAKEWEFEITGTETVHEAHFATTMDEFKYGG